MEQMTNDEVVEIRLVVSGVAHELARKYRDYTTAADISQEMWAWMLESPKRWRFIFESADEDDRKRQEYFLRRNLTRFGERHCRMEKAKVSGYRHTDEYFYTEGLIVALIEAKHNGVDTLGEPTGEKSRTKRTLSEGGEVDAMKADLEQALRALDPDEQRLMDLLYGEKMAAREVGEHLGVTRQAVEKRASKILDRMIVTLGGHSPWRH